MALPHIRLPRSCHERKNDNATNWSSIWDRVRTELNQAGIDLETMGVRIEELGGKLGRAVKVVFVAPDLQESVDAMNREQRDQVIMVRVDEATLRQLDAWVKTEAVKSRSEAAAVFIREGLKVRASELEKLEDALADVDRARERLHERVKEVFGEKDARPRADLRCAARTSALLSRATRCRAGDGAVGDGVSRRRRTPSSGRDREAVNLATFDRAWSLIADTHWDPDLGGLDWQAVRDELRPQGGRRQERSRAPSVIEEMLGRLGQSHFALLPERRRGPARRRAVTDDDGLPGCSAASQRRDLRGDGATPSADGEPGLELRLLDGDQVVVTRVVAGTARPPRRAFAPDGVCSPSTGAPLEGSLECIRRVDDVAFQRQVEIRWLRGLLEGPNGSSVRAAIRRAAAAASRTCCGECRRRASVVRFGNLPPSTFQFERTSTETEAARASRRRPVQHLAAPGGCRVREGDARAACRRRGGDRPARQPGRGVRRSTGRRRTLRYESRSAWAP